MASPHPESEPSERTFTLPSTGAGTELSTILEVEEDTRNYSAQLELGNENLEGVVDDGDTPFKNEEPQSRQVESVVNSLGAETELLPIGEVPLFGGGGGDADATADLFENKVLSTKASSDSCPENDNFEQNYCPDLHRSSDSSVSVSAEELYENKEFQSGSCSENEGECEDIISGFGKTDVNSDTEVSSVYSESYLGRTDIFRPKLTNKERKMLGAGSIPDMTKVVWTSTPSTRSSSVVRQVPPFGFSDGDQWPPRPRSDAITESHSLLSVDCSRNAASVTTITDAVRLNGIAEERALAVTFNADGLTEHSKPKRVSFIDYEDPSQEDRSSCRRRCPRHYVFPRLDAALENEPIQTDLPEGRVDLQESTKAGPWSPLTNDIDLKHSLASSVEALPNPKLPFLLKNQAFVRLASLSNKSIKSKKLETKMQQQIRTTLFNYESQYATEDLKFKGKVQALELDYQKKFLSLVQDHNLFQKKLYKKFRKEIEKTEKLVKKEALQGHLNEGNCFQIAHDIASIKAPESEKLF